ncbi:MAG: DUF2520 domain-containing protein [bacterium]
MNKTFGFIGFGKLGSTLCSALAENNSIKWIVESNLKVNNTAQNIFPEVSIFSSIIEIDTVPNYIFLTVEDSRIEETVNALSEHLKEKLEGCLVLHCSGALPTNILNTCKDYGAYTGVIHPYQTFYYPSVNLLKGIGWSIRSENRIEELKVLIESMGGIPYVLRESENITSLYHSSAVVASNFLNTLLSTAEEIANYAGIPSEKFIPQIVKTTIDNNFSQVQSKKDFPLTGPFARVDINIIENHIEALKPYSHLLKSYCYFALATIEKLKYDKLADEKVLDEMERLIKDILSET